MAKLVPRVSLLPFPLQGKGTRDPGNKIDP